jgi:TolB-like protein/Tfp pilus assembly protein PilF
VLLYRLVTGEFPVRAATLDELREAHRRRRTTRLRDVRSDLPSAFVRVIDRAIAAAPADRYASAGELEADLDKSLERPIAAESGSSGSPIFRPRYAIWGSVALAVAAMIVSVIASPWPLFRIPWRTALDPPPIRSIAVLPLSNLSGDATQDYLADGLTEALIDSLARVPGLRVISRTSVMQFKGTTKSLREVATALNVDAVLEGSFVRSESRVRISTDLVHVATEHHVWVNSYDREMGDVLALQAEVARSVAREVQIQLTPKQQAGLGALQSVNGAVEDAYFQGRFYWNKGTNEGYQKALDYFRQAIAIDPTFGRAYAGEADVYNLLPAHLPPATAYPLAKAAANRALALDSTLAEAHTSLAFAAFIFDRDWKAAEASFLRALTLNPNYAVAHLWYADFLTAMGRFSEAESHYATAEQLDPLAPRIRASFGDGLYYERRFDEAIRKFRESLTIGDGDTAALLNLTLAYAFEGQFAQADGALEMWLTRAGESPTYRAISALVKAMEGDKAGARSLVEELASRGSSIDFVADMISYAYVYLGDRDRAFDLLDRAEKARAPGLLWANVDPVFDPLRGDARFSDLLRRLRLAP